MLPQWLRLLLQHVLIGEIYPHIRAIAVAFSPTKTLHVRYYLDRQPTEFDRERISVVLTELLSHTSSNNDISSVKEECTYSHVSMRDLDRLGGLVYARYEYSPENDDDTAS